MKCLVAFSGGKDSQAGLIWALKESGFDKKNIYAVFCNTGWEHEITYNHIRDTCDSLGVKLIELKSKKYDGFIDLSEKKKRFSSSQARFCTEELKIKPMIDFILDELQDHFLLVQGIRKNESKKRSQMNRECTYFKYYFTPYKVKKIKDKKNLNFITGLPEYKEMPVFHTYRKKEIIKFKEKFIDDLIRPCFDWRADQVLDYILRNGMKPNELYYKGFSRIGCFPCIQANHWEIKLINELYPEYIEKIRLNEGKIGHSFFTSNYIPDQFCSKFSVIEGKKKFYPLIDDVINYVKNSENELKIFKEKINPRKCMSFYNICE